MPLNILIYHISHESYLDVVSSVTILHLRRGSGFWVVSVGCLLAVYLKKHGYNVAIFESRADPRTVNVAGRSINLVITSRGLHALTSLSPELGAKVTDPPCAKPKAPFNSN